MGGYSATSIPKPKDWQDFERKCRVLIACVLEDSNTQLHGRAGQRQNGVDIYGRRSTNGNSVGVQCKGRSEQFSSPLSAPELRAEVAKCNKFRPQLDEFIMLTSGADDAAIQLVARELTIEEQDRLGRPFRVVVWGWETIEQRVSEYPTALQAFHPDLTPFSNALLENSAKTLSVANDVHTRLVRIEALIRSDFSDKLGAPPKISGSVGNNSRRPFVSARILIPDQKKDGFVSFLVDTGADMSMLAPMDLLRLGIDATRGTEKLSVSGLSGIVEMSMVSAHLVFRGSSDCLFGYETQIALSRSASSTTPSILGRDILRNWSMFFDHDSNTLEFGVVRYDFKNALTA